MDPITLATAFGTIVQLLGQFISESDRREYSEFLNWLKENHHKEILELLNQNVKTSIGIKALLHKEKEVIEEILIQLNVGFIELGKKIDGFKEVIDGIESINTNEGIGGDGGDGVIEGNRGTIIGGRGGVGGLYGRGGKGGGGYIKGDDGLIAGGDGGNAGGADGRGGRGARSTLERMDMPTHLWGFGKGGSGANHPEYERRLGVLLEIRKEYFAG